MAFRKADADAVRSAIASGELEVEYSDRRVKYRRMEDLFKALSMIEGELETAVGNVAVAQQVLFVPKNGWRR